MSQHRFFMLLLILSLTFIMQPALHAQDDAPAFQATDFRTVDATPVKVGDTIAIAGILEVMVIHEESGRTLGGLWSEKHFCFFVFDLDPDNAELFQLEGKKVAVKGIIIERLGEHYKIKVDKFKKM